MITGTLSLTAAWTIPRKASKFEILKCPIEIFCSRALLIVSRYVSPFENTVFISVYCIKFCIYRESSTLGTLAHPEGWVGTYFGGGFLGVTPRPYGHKQAGAKNAGLLLGLIEEDETCDECPPQTLYALLREDVRPSGHEADFDACWLTAVLADDEIALELRRIFNTNLAQDMGEIAGDFVELLELQA